MQDNQGGGMTGLPITIVAAVARNGALGFQNAIPWRASSDLKRFKEITWGRPLIMGRKTYQSIGRPLPGRETVVVTRDGGWLGTPAPERVHVAGDFAAALARANELADFMHCAEIIVAGGAEIYRQALPLGRFLRLTRVDCAPEADAFFPEVDWTQWRELRREPAPRGEKDECNLEYIDYQRC
ncbi:dihydrofolate reductase [Rhodoblastus acidophilus]|uniref:Dihydrofolate reductase n=1 Tax=Rhodoblastus acidophilus TaxID=1074 RepID=A0A212RU46_RHOAC|nr:dihydrofolate reductase [Rhodoblastus acidophilus]MCW2315390.1 dihydrofolate reductase [Rhodoblastus acidophilus]SNB76081.1 dihydrofolate reductase [Rhodoblastus acidophilus]